MPVVVVTNTDVATVPYHGEHYRFKLDSGNRGPFAGMLPLSHVLDPAREADCINHLALQFGSISNEFIGNVFLHHKGPHFITEALMAGGANALPVLLPHVPENLKAKILPALASDNYNEIGNKVVEVLTEHFATATPAQKEAMLESILRHVEQHNLPDISGLNIMDIFSKSIDYSLQDVKGARHLTQDPMRAAQEHFAAIRRAAQAQNVGPGRVVDTYMPNVEAALASCPPHIAEGANRQNMKIVLVSDGAKVADVAPAYGMQLFGETMGISVGDGIYAKEALLNNPAVMREEIIHEVERRAVAGPTGRTRFSSQPEWQAAIAHDTANAAQSSIYKTIIDKSNAAVDKTLGSPKSNRAIHTFHMPLMPGSAMEADFIEAVPDIFHIEAYVKDVIAKEGNINIGGKFGYGGTTFNNSDAIMHELFPNAWPMLNGPQKGHRLVQHASGQVEQIAHAVATPQGAKDVVSLAEHCTKSLGHEFEGVTKGAAPITENVIAGFMRTEKWMGKKGLAVAAGAAVAIGVTYAASRFFSRHKQTNSREERPERLNWVHKVSQRPPDQHVSR